MFAVVPTVLTGELITAAHFNAYLRDNMAETAPAKVTTQGDMVYATGANALTRLGIGAAGIPLVATSGSTPAWAQVSTGGIADSSITANKIVDGQVTAAKIADLNITTAKINDAQVTNAKLAANAVTSDKILDDTIDAVDLYDAFLQGFHGAGVWTYAYSGDQLQTITCGGAGPAAGRQLSFEYNPDGTVSVIRFRESAAGSIVRSIVYAYSSGLLSTETHA